MSDMLLQLQKPELAKSNCMTDAETVQRLPELKLLNRPNTNRSTIIQNISSRDYGKSQLLCPHDMVAKTTEQRLLWTKRVSQLDIRSDIQQVNFQYAS